MQVGDAVAQGCFTERKDAQGAGTGVFETDEAAWVGGFPLQPRGGGRLVVAPTDQAAPLRAEGTGVDLVLGPLVVPAPLSEIKPLVASYVVGASAVDAFERLVALPFLKGSSGQVRVTWAPGGRGAKVEAKASIEEMTKVLGKAFAPAAGGSIGTLSGKLTLTLKNGEPADITKGELVIPAVSVEVKDTSPPLREGFGGATFKAQRVAGRVEWSGEVTVLFPWKNDAGGSNQGKITGRLFFTDGSIGGLGLAASGFEEPIGRTGWDLTGVDGNLVLSPLLAFDFGVTAEQRSVFAGQKLFKLTGNVKGLRLAKPDCASGKNPFEFVGTANVPPMETAHIGKGKLRVLMCAYVPSADDFAFEVGASADLSIDLPPTAGLLTAKGSATGWFRGAGSASSLVRTDFNLDGNFEVKMPIFGTIAASGVLSSEGYAFCGSYGFISAGFATHNWVSLPGDLSGCDFTPYRVATSAAASATARAVRVPAGQSAFSIAVRGSGNAPRVRVVGPHGERFVTPAAASALKTSAAIIAPIDQLHTTYVYLHRPAAGTWRVEPLPGSSTITRVQTATQLPKPIVHAAVTVRSGTASLRWRSPVVPGQRIELVERSSGQATTVQHATAKSHGTVHFTPTDPLATRGSIEAVIFRNGLPRARLTVARYQVKPPARPARVSHLTAKRTTAGLNITWRKVTRAREYIVTVSDGTTPLTRALTKRTALTFTDPPTTALTVTVQARDASQRPGVTATVKVP